MNRRTISALNRINRRFYSDQSEQFSRTRKTPWPGWTRVAATLRAHRSTIVTAPCPSILDVGSGNSRFLPFISDHLPDGFRYVGIDTSLSMLAEGRRGAVDESSVPAMLVATDLVNGCGLECLEPASIDLAAAFGLLHHIPGRQTRERLLRSIANCLKPNGALAVSFWQFGKQERFLRRVIPWDAYNRQTSELIDVAELEEGDMMLTWGEAQCGDAGPKSPVARYWHFTDESSADGLIDSLDMVVLARFLSDGDGGGQNLYFVLRKSSGR